MKYLSIVFVAAITLVSCGGGLETACDCVDAMAALDQEDTAAVAEWTAANGEACDALMADTAQDMSACTEAATEEAATEEVATEEAAAEEAATEEAAAE